MPSPSTTRQPRRSREELRTLLVDSAEELLLREGLGLGAEWLTFKRVFDQVETDTGMRLTNASVIRRVWENLADYQTDVLCDLAVDIVDDNWQGILDALASLLAGPPPTSPEGWRALRREVCRVAGTVATDGLVDSRRWWLDIGLWALATVSEHTEQRRRIRGALLLGYADITQRDVELFDAMAPTLGLRLRPGATSHQFAVLAVALNEGCALRARIDPEMADIHLPTGPGGADQVWTIFGIGLEALIDQFYEPDPDIVGTPS